MNERADALEQWLAAQRELDEADRDRDYADVGTNVEEGRQRYQRAIGTDSGAVADE